MPYPSIRIDICLRTRQIEVERWMEIRVRSLAPFTVEMDLLMSEHGTKEPTSGRRRTPTLIR